MSGLLSITELWGSIRPCLNRYGSIVLKLTQFKTFCTIFTSLLISFLLSGCPLLQDGPPIKTTELPADMFATPSQAIAYHVGGKPGVRYDSAQLSLSPLLKHGVEPANGFLLFTKSNGKYWPVSHRQSGTLIVADLIGDKDYILAANSYGHFENSFDTLCRWSDKLRLKEDRRFPKLCQLILCSSGIFNEERLFKEFGLPASEFAMQSTSLGGWIGEPTQICEQCTARLPYDQWRFMPPTFSCVSPALTGSCENGLLLLSDDFESETVGASPSPSLSGSPSGDSRSINDSVQVVSSSLLGSKAVEITRQTNFSFIKSWLDEVLAPGATDTGSYCISFKGYAGTVDIAAINISLFSTEGIEAWRLSISNGKATLVSGDGTLQLTAQNFAPGLIHQFRFELNLDLGRFTLYVDGTPVGTGLPLIDSAFGIPGKLRFLYNESIVEGFSGSFVVDDIVIRKSNITSIVGASNLIPIGYAQIGGAENVSQTFTATQSKQLLGIEVAALKCQATSTDTITLDVGQSTRVGGVSLMGTNFPGGSIQCMDTPDVLQMDVEGPGYFDLSSLNINLNQGDTYYFQLSSTKIEGFNIGISDDLYNGGTASYSGIAATSDLVFKVMTEP